jgi:hypothetical protein
MKPLFAFSVLTLILQLQKRSTDKDKDEEESDSESSVDFAKLENEGNEEEGNDGKMSKRPSFFANMFHKVGNNSKSGGKNDHTRLAPITFWLAATKH